MHRTRRTKSRRAGGGMNRFGVKINAHFGKTGVLACLGKQASSLFLHLLPWEDRRPRLSRQTGFQPVSYLPIRFEMPNNRITHYHDGEYNDPGEVFPQIQGRPQICILLPSVLPESLRFFTSVKSG